MSDRTENSQTTKCSASGRAVSLNLPALSDVAMVVNDLIATEHPALADTIHEVALREFLSHLIIATAPNQPLQAAATRIVCEAVLNRCTERSDE